MSDRQNKQSEIINRESAPAHSNDGLPAPLLNDTRFSEAQLLNQTVQEMLQAETMNAVWETVRRRGLQLLAADGLAVFFPHPEKNEGVSPCSINLNSSYLEIVRRQATAHPILAPWQLSQPLVLNHIDSADLDSLPKTALQEAGITHAAAFPLPADEDGPGVLVLYRRRARPFSSAEILNSTYFAALVAAARARLAEHDQLLQQLEQAVRLNEIVTYVHSSDSIPDILSNVVSMAAQLVNADAGLLGLMIGEDLMSFYPYNLPRQVTLRPLHKNESHPWQIVAGMSPQIINQFDQESEEARSWLQTKVYAYLGVPILSHNECFGSINLFHMHRPGQFSTEDSRLLQTIGQQAGFVIQNLRGQTEASQRSTVLSNALERMENRDQLRNKFVHSVSHELRSPLSIIFGHAELLHSGDLGPLNDAQHQATQIILRRINMITNLVDDLSALLAAETQEFRREEINPIILFYSLLADYRIQSQEKGLLLEADIADELPMIMGDPNHLRRVFDNLLSNAFKYTAAGGNVKIKAWSENSALFVEVSDTGEGIPETHLPRIFERFYQVTDSNKPRRQGIGLGLSLVKEIIEAHRGTISVYSKEGMGTAFTIRLPLL